MLSIADSIWSTSLVDASDSVTVCFVSSSATTISHSKVDALKIEIGKGTKEMRALQLMIQTYTNTPQVENLRALIPSCFMCVQKLQICLFQFGDAAKFQPELNTVAARVQKQEAELSALQVKYFLHWI